MTETLETTLGELITAFYDEYLELYGDPDLASVATAATINELLATAGVEDDVAERDASEAA